MDFFSHELRNSLLANTAPNDIARRRQINAMSATALMAAVLAACGGGGSNPAPAVVPPELQIIPDGGAAVASDGIGLLPEESDGSPTSQDGRIRIGKIIDNKDPDNEAIYRIATGEDAATDNADFQIENNILYYIGKNSGDFEAVPRKKYTINIERFNNEDAANAEGGGNPQILPYIVNLQDQTEILTITPTGSTVAIASNGLGVLQENTAKGTELGTIDDSIDAAGNITYRLAAAAEGNNNALFLISGDGLKLIYNGEPLDYDSLTPAQRILTLRIERIRDGDTDNPQTLEYIINLQNLNDESPVLTAEGGTIDGTKLQFLYDFVNEQVGDTSSSSAVDSILLTLIGIPLSSDSLSIKFIRRNPNSDNDDGTIIVSVTDQGGSPATTSSNIDKITISYKGGHAGGKEGLINDMNVALKAHDVLQNYSPNVENNTGFFSSFGSDGLSTITSSTTPLLKVASGTTGIIADFSGTDVDNLQALIYSVSDTVADSGHAGYFTIDPANGNLRFATGTNAPTFQTGAGANNIYAITVTVSDGTRTATKELQIELTAAASPSSTASEALPSAAEAVPNKEPQKWEPSPFDNIFDDDPFGPIGGGGDGVL